MFNIESGVGTSSSNNGSQLRNLGSPGLASSPKKTPFPSSGDKEPESPRAKSTEKAPLLGQEADSYGAGPSTGESAPLVHPISTDTPNLPLPTRGSLPLPGSPTSSRLSPTGEKAPLLPPGESSSTYSVIGPPPIKAAEIISTGSLAGPSASAPKAEGAQEAKQSSSAASSSESGSAGEAKPAAAESGSSTSASKAEGEQEAKPSSAASSSQSGSASEAKPAAAGQEIQPLEVQAAVPSLAPPIKWPSSLLIRSDKQMLDYIRNLLEIMDSLQDKLREVRGLPDCSDANLQDLISGFIKTLESTKEYINNRKLTIEAGNNASEARRVKYGSYPLIIAASSFLGGVLFSIADSLGTEGAPKIHIHNVGLGAALGASLSAWFVGFFMIDSLWMGATGNAGYKVLAMSGFSLPMPLGFRWATLVTAVLIHAVSECYLSGLGAFTAKGPFIEAIKPPAEVFAGGFVAALLGICSENTSMKTLVSAILAAFHTGGLVLRPLVDWSSVLRRLSGISRLLGGSNSPEGEGLLRADASSHSLPTGELTLTQKQELLSELGKAFKQYKYFAGIAGEQNIEKYEPLFSSCATYLKQIEAQLPCWSPWVKDCPNSYTWIIVGLISTVGLIAASFLAIEHLWGLTNLDSASKIMLTLASAAAMNVFRGIADGIGKLTNLYNVDELSLGGRMALSLYMSAIDFAINILLFVFILNPDAENMALIVALKDTLGVWNRVFINILSGGMPNPLVNFVLNIIDGVIQALRSGYAFSTRSSPA